MFNRTKDKNETYQRGEKKLKLTKSPRSHAISAIVGQSGPDGSGAVGIFGGIVKSMTGDVSSSSDVDGINDGRSLGTTDGAVEGTSDGASDGKNDSTGSGSGVIPKQQSKKLPSPVGQQSPVKSRLAHVGFVSHVLLSNITGGIDGTLMGEKNGDGGWLASVGADVP